MSTQRQEWNPREEARKQAPRYCDRLLVEPHEVLACGRDGIEKIVREEFRQALGILDYVQCPFAVMDVVRNHMVDGFMEGLNECNRHAG